MIDRNVGKYIAAGVPSIFPLTAPDGTGDLTGAAYDRANQGDQLGMPLSAKLYAALSIGGSAKTALIKFKVQDSADNSSWADYTDPSTGVVASVSVQGSATVNTAGSKSVDLSAARRYVRVFCDHLDMTITSACTSVPLAVLIFGGFANLPAGAAPVQ